MRHKRILLYSHDTYGLGHLRRNLLLASRLCQLPEKPAILIATGSPRTQAFELPDHCDTFKLPAVTKTPEGTYEARNLPVSIDEVTRMRGDLIVSAYRAFDPDLILIDHSPTGMRGELLPLFREVECAKLRRNIKVVLGLRDIIDSPERVRAEWDQHDAWRWLETLYDRVLVYGDPRVRTTAQDLELDTRYPGKIQHVGYLGRPGLLSDSSSTARADRRSGAGNGHPDDLPIVLVTVGGGGDGQRVLRAVLDYLEGLEQQAPFRTIMVTGPFLSRSRFRDVHARAGRLAQPIEVLRFTNRLLDYLARSTAVISMAGYNSVAEIIATRVPCLLVPRETPREEQTLRVHRLARAVDIDFVPMRELDAAAIAAFLERLRTRERAETTRRIDLEGLDRAANSISELLVSEHGQPVQPDHHARAADSVALDPPTPIGPRTDDRPSSTARFAAAWLGRILGRAGHAST